MNPSDAKPTHEDAPPGDKEEATGLPWFRTWRGVYVFVFGSFIVWIALLLALTMIYS